MQAHLKSSIHLVSACEPRPSAASIAALSPRNAWSRDKTPSVRGCSARSARKPLEGDYCFGAGTAVALKGGGGFFSLASEPRRYLNGASST